MRLRVAVEMHLQHAHRNFIRNVLRVRCRLGVMPKTLYWLVTIDMGLRCGETVLIIGEIHLNAPLANSTIRIVQTYVPNRSRMEYQVKSNLYHVLAPGFPMRATNFQIRPCYFRTISSPGDVLAIARPRSFAPVIKNLNRSPHFEVLS